MLLLYAWLSAVVFVVALTYVGYFFVTLTPQPPQESPIVALALDVGLFGVFATHHSLMARSGAKRWLERHVPPEIERATYVWVASVLLIVTCLLWRDLPGTVYTLTGWLRGIGIASQAAGLIIIAMAVSVLDPLELAGVRQLLPSRRVANGGHEPNLLRIRGPYRWLRHPIYLGWVLAVFGTPDMSTTRLAFAGISTAYVVIAVPWEERSMAETFGDAYRRYTQQVRWRIVPWVY